MVLELEILKNSLVIPALYRNWSKASVMTFIILLWGAMENVLEEKNSSEERKVKLMKMINYLIIN